MRNTLITFSFGLFAFATIIVSVASITNAENGSLSDVPNYSPQASAPLPTYSPSSTTSAILPSEDSRKKSSSFRFPSFGNTSMTSSLAPDQFISYVAEHIMPIILTISGVLAVFYVMFAGLTYITALGNVERAKHARTGIINVVIGVVIILSAFFIVRFATSLGQTVTQLDTTNS